MPGKDSSAGLASLSNYTARQKAKNKSQSLSVSRLLGMLQAGKCPGAARQTRKKAALRDHALQTGVKPQETQQFVTALALMSFLLVASSKEMKSPYPKTPLQNRNHQDEGSSATQLPLRKEREKAEDLTPFVSTNKSQGLVTFLLSFCCPSKLTKGDFREDLEGLRRV